jgi:hypothetical protein
VVGGLVVIGGALVVGGAVVGGALVVTGGLDVVGVGLACAQPARIRPTNKRTTSGTKNSFFN